MGSVSASRENRVHTVDYTTTAFIVTLSSLLLTIVTDYIPLRFETYQNIEQSNTYNNLANWHIVWALLETIISPTRQYVDGLISKTYL
jgi:hypothetical protein